VGYMALRIDRLPSAPRGFDTQILIELHYDDPLHLGVINRHTPWRRHGHVGRVWWPWARRRVKDEGDDTGVVLGGVGRRRMGPHTTKDETTARLTEGRVEARGGRRSEAGEGPAAVLCSRSERSDGRRRGCGA
jgi:hypothetical protein